MAQPGLSGMENDQPGEYQKLVIKQFPPRTLRETAEGAYWKRFKAPVLAQQVGAVSHVDFCPVTPHRCAVTSSTRVLIYDPVTREQQAQISRFRDKAYGATYRSDGRLIVAGGESSVVQVFDAASRTLLRQLKGHEAPVHATIFAGDKLKALSGSDDSTVRMWDVTSGSQDLSLSGHSDYIRSLAGSPASSTMFASGSYDHNCKLWDMRSGQSVASMDHGSPIEAVAFLPSGGLVATAGGQEVCVWDVLGGTRLLHRAATHQKTVTCLHVAAAAGADSATRLLSASLDGLLKVHELDGLRVVHASRYPAPILSMALSPDASMLAVGLSDGTLSMRKAARPARTGNVAKKPRLSRANAAYLLRGQAGSAVPGDTLVAAGRSAKLQPYDQALRRFKHSQALDDALQTRDTPIIITLLEELAARGALNAAIGGRDAQNLLPLLQHLHRNVGHPRHARLLVDIAHRVLDIYAGAVGLSPEIDRTLEALSKRVSHEVQMQQKLAVLQGTLEPLIAVNVS